MVVSEQYNQKMLLDELFSFVGLVYEVRLSACIFVLLLPQMRQQ